MLTLALSKGRILEDTAGLLAQCGIRLDSSAVDSRQLILPTDDPGLRLLIVRASDVSIYVQHGAADLGIALLFGGERSRPERLSERVTLLDTLTQ